VKGPARLEAGTPDTVELRMGARPENLALARLALGGVASIAGASEAAVADLKVAVTEACTNAIQHGSAPGRLDGTGRSIVVRYRVGEELLEVEVEDEGAGFDPLDPGAPGGQNGDGQGMGLMIIRALTDEVLVESDETGSRVSFAKRLRAEA